MRIYLAILILIFFTKSFSQNDIIDEHYKLPDEIECNTNVKSISIEYKKFFKDTIKSNVNVNFSNNKVQTINYITNENGKFVKKVKFDKHERLSEISTIKNGENKVFIKTFFNKNKLYPDSVYIYRDFNFIEKYINNFIDGYKIKQEHFNNNILQDYKEFNYDDLGRLSSKTHIFPENNNGELLISNQTNGTTSLTFYPLEKIEFEYTKKADTLITVVIKKQLNTREIIKEFADDSIDLKISSTFKNKELVSINSIYKAKDSISDTRIHYKDGKVFRYYNTYKNKNGYITKWTSHTEDTESIYKVIYVNLYDKNKNWIRREIFINDKLTEIITRKITY